MGFTNKSILFEGSNEYLLFGSILLFERTDPFSCSFWINSTTQTATYYELLTKRNGGPEPGWFIEMTNGEIQFTLSNTWATNCIVVYSGFKINDGAWHHVVCAYDGSSTAAGVSMYIDDTIITPTVLFNNLVSTIVNTASTFRIADREADTCTHCFPGYLDEVAFYSKKLSAAEATWIYNNGVPRSLADIGHPSNLLVWWRMGEGDTYPTVLAQPLPTNYTPGTKCLDLNNDTQDETVDFGNIAALNFTKIQPFSYGIWVKYTGSGWGLPMCKGIWNGTGIRGWLISFWGVGAPGRFSGNLGDGSGMYMVKVTYASGLNNGLWHLVTITG